ncbi:MAG: S8 family serine peptidase [Phycisphaerales bacterium]|nr:S8 family serine peptidase [Phycisphaerales bacterium]
MPHALLRRAAVAAVLACAGSLALAGVPTRSRPNAIFLNAPAAREGDQPGRGFITLDQIAAELNKPARVLVRFEPFADRAAGPLSDASLQSLGVERVESTIDLVPGLTIFNVDPDRAPAIAQALSATPGVRYAELDGMAHKMAQSTPYGITMVKAPSFWPKFGKGNGTRLAVLDSGLDLTHPDLPVATLAQSFVAGLSVDDIDQHGSHVAGTALALDNTLGVVGVAPQAQLLVGKVLNNQGGGLWSDIIAGINWAVANNAKVINMSLGGPSAPQSLQDACDAALAAGTLVVAAAGNDGDTSLEYPGAYASVMAIAAVDENRAWADFSNHRPDVSVAAPGVAVLSTVPLSTLAVKWGNTTKLANKVLGTADVPARGFTGKVYDCAEGFLFDFPSTVRGEIALVQRSFLSDLLGVDFINQNAWDAGAYAVILMNNTSGNFTADIGYDENFRPAVTVSQADGNAILALGDGATVTIAQTANGHDYDLFDGTSMATPHVAGAAALLFSAFKPAPNLPALPPQTVRYVLERTASDAGTPGRDDYFGHGIINAEAAGNYLHGRIKCPGDLNADNIVDDLDFQQFVAFYNTLTAPAKYTNADFNGDSLTDDTDFQVFVVSYDAVLCP